MNSNYYSYFLRCVSSFVHFLFLPFSSFHSLIIPSVCSSFSHCLPLFFFLLFFSFTWKEKFLEFKSLTSWELNLSHLSLSDLHSWIPDLFLMAHHNGTCPTAKPDDSSIPVTMIDRSISFFPSHFSSSSSQKTCSNVMYAHCHCSVV